MFPVTPSVLDAARAPETESVEATVEEARERKPAPKVASPPARKVEDAWSGEPAMMSPEEKVLEATEMNPPPARKRPATDEEAPAANPPEASSVKTDEEATFCTRSASPVWPVKTFKVRFEAVVEVAAIVATAFTSGLEVPTPRLSVMVVNATTVPKSVHAVPWSVPQMTFPEESVSKASVQEGTVVICNPPVWTWSPPRIVEEAVTPAVPFTMRVEVAKRMPAVEVPEVKMLPWIDNVCAGEVVPMPRVP